MTSTALLLFFAAAQAHDPIDDRGGAAPTPEAETVAEAPAKDAEEADAAEVDWDVLVPHGAHHSARFTLTEGTWMSVSVSGDRLVFDLLGDLWSMPLSGGKADRLTADAAWDSEPRFSPDGRRIAFVSDRDGNEQIWVMDRDGRNLHKVTDEDEARVTDPVWDPTGDWLIVRRRTVDTRSIGVTELWRVHVDGGTPGFALTSLDEHPHAGESTTDGRFVYFSNRHGRFNYDENPVAGLWDVQRLDLQTNEVRTVVHGAGSASRPKLSPDGKTLAFVSRDRSHTLLELMDLATGRRRTLSQDLDHDQLEGFALHGTYPDISWLPDGSGLVLWARGQLWKLGLDGTETAIPFEATGSWDFHDVQRWKRTIPDTVQARVIRWPVRSKDGRLAFSAMGRLWTQDPGGEIAPASSGTGYSPAFSPDGKRLAWTSWTDCPAPDTAVSAAPAPDCGGRLHLSQGKKQETLPVEGLLINPAWSPDGKTLVVLRGVGGSSSPDLGSQPWYELVRLTEGKKGRWDSVVIGSTDIDQFRAPRPTIVGDRIYWAESRPTEPRRPGKAVLVSVDLDGDDKIEHLSLGGAQEVRLSPTGKRVAFKRGHQAWVADVPPQMRDLDVDALPHRKLTEQVGDWLEWSPDGRELSWMAGNTLNRLVVDAVTLPEKAEAPKPQQEELKLSLSADARRQPGPHPRHRAHHGARRPGRRGGARRRHGGHRRRPHPLGGQRAAPGGGADHRRHRQDHHPRPGRCARPPALQRGGRLAGAGVALPGEPRLRGHHGARPLGQHRSCVHAKRKGRGWL